MNVNKNLKVLAAPVLGISLLFPTVANVSAAEQKPTVNTPAADLRASLDQLLSEHFALAFTAMTTAYNGSNDAGEAMKALDQNALDMQPVITSLYGEKGGEQFEKIFRAHNNYTDDYAKAVKANDKDAEKKADMMVDKFVKDFSAFLGAATEGKLPQNAAEQALRMHEDLVQKAFDDYVNGDYKGTYTTYREGFKQMFDVSKALSSAIVAQMPDKFKNTKADTPSADLRSALNRLASEHFALATMEMQKEYAGANDFDFVNWAQDANTADFKAAISSIYGNQAGEQFVSVWQPDHIDAQSDYVQAVKKNDNAAKKDVVNRISGFTKEFGSFLGTATGGKLPAQAAQDALMAHEQSVRTTFDHAASGNYGDAYKSWREGYKMMFGVGQALGNGIVSQNPGKFAGTSMPGQMPHTGGGGASETTDSQMPWMEASIAAMLVLGSALVIKRRKSSEQ
ncbi:copper amine oxidase [Bacillus sp. MUM 13]|uniref:copper amine oxidase n=1 Tax=Bacillus sp. MUM 13 TaxID=1678001 RepID=UPI0008F5602B|nr:copper amine oxidase [Bacillus sp. MUM 13]OIK11373.1 copper amine oxidase [Bacillus sp. MUM 13]